MDPGTLLVGGFGLTLLAGAALTLRDAASHVRAARRAAFGPETDLGDLDDGRHRLKLGARVADADSPARSFLGGERAPLSVARVSRPAAHAALNRVLLFATRSFGEDKRRTLFESVRPTTAALSTGRTTVTLPADDVDVYLPPLGWDRRRRCRTLADAPASARRVLPDDHDGSLERGWFEARVLRERAFDRGEGLRVFGTATVRRRPDGEVELGGGDLLLTTAPWTLVALRELRAGAGAFLLALAGLGIGLAALAVAVLAVAPPG